MMQKLFAGIFMCFLSLEASAMTADCYSDNKQIYHGIVDDVYFEDSYIVLFQFKNNSAVYLRAECVIKDSIKK